jgi:type II secretory pathway pseudopilin PulG
MPMAKPNRTIRRNREAGYTLLLAVFLVATMIIAAAVATPNIVTEGRRQKEDDMVWRGNQYARAIGLYYKRFGRFPTKIEDLTNQTNGVRFLRQAYKDPMNKDDGSWRFIYVGPSGQLIGSNKQTSLLQGAVGGAGFAGLQGMSGPLGGMVGQMVGNAQNMQPGMGAPGVPVSQVPGSGGPGSSSPGSMSDNQPQSLGGSVIGGNIIGVGSKIDKPSLRVYLGADNYKDWEFIWNPLSLRAAPGQNPVNPNGVAVPPGPGAPNPAQPAPPQ